MSRRLNHPWNRHLKPINPWWCSNSNKWQYANINDCLTQAGWNFDEELKYTHGIELNEREFISEELGVGTSLDQEDRMIEIIDLHFIFKPKRPETFHVRHYQPDRWESWKQELNQQRHNSINEYLLKSSAEQIYNVNEELKKFQYHIELNKIPNMDEFNKIRRNLRFNISKTTNQFLITEDSINYLIRILNVFKRQTKNLVLWESLYDWVIDA